MTEPRWHEGIPPVEAIAAHEWEHCSLKGNQYGDWIIVHPDSGLVKAHPSLISLRIIKGEIYWTNDFGIWQLITEAEWAAQCRYFPVGPDGLPGDYATLKETDTKRWAETYRLQQERDDAQRWCNKSESLLVVQDKAIEALSHTLAAAQERDRKLREALRPFADMHRDGCDLNEISCVRGHASDMTILRSGDFKRAADALESPQASAEPLYYIQNKGYSGNSLLFWRESGKGYTCNLDDAWRLPKAQAEAICRDRPNEDVMWPVAVIDKATERHCNSEKLRDENGNWIEPIPVGQNGTEAPCQSK